MKALESTPPPEKGHEVLDILNGMECEQRHTMLRWIRSRECGNLKKIQPREVRDASVGKTVLFGGSAVVKANR